MPVSSHFILIYSFKYSISKIIQVNLRDKFTRRLLNSTNFCHNLFATDNYHRLELDCFEEV